MSWLSPEDRQLAELLGGARPVEAPPPFVVGALFERAERHGVAGVIQDKIDAAGWPLDVALRDRLERARLARELDHSAHLDMLSRVDIALTRAGLRAAALKGPLFAERFYDRPAARATSDIDLLVGEEDVDRAVEALRDASYELADDEREQAWSFAEHHHFHLTHARALPLELHFHAYRGLGSILRSAPLLHRSRAAPGAWSAIHVLAPADELVFLAVHAAAHRFVRLGWLYDLSLLLATMTEAEMEESARRADETGFGAPVSLALSLVNEALDASRSCAEHFRALTPIRGRLLRAVAPEPRHPVLRSATRFIYTIGLCPDARSALRYGVRSSRDHVKRGLAAMRRSAATP